jgi:hypothetical protein
MSTLELVKNLGKVAEWGDGHGLKYEVTIMDSRVRWGEVDYLITPKAGEGSRWVSNHSLRIVES